MKTIVVYRSKSGFVEKYAQWIAEELSAEIHDASEVTVDMLEKYDTIIYGGGLYAVGINGVKLITQNLHKLKGKKLIVYASGVTPFRQEDIDKVRDSNFTPEQQEHIRFFYVRGGFNFSKLTPVDKILITLLKWKLQRKKELLPDERGMLNAIGKPVDFAQRKNIDALVAYVKQDQS